MVLVVVAGCRAPEPEPERGSVQGRAEVVATKGYAEALAGLDARLREAETRAAARGGWGDHELVARLYMGRARLTASPADWREAERALAAGFAAAPPGGGPVLTQLELALSLHRLDEAEALIERAEAAPVSTPRLQRELAIARGELAGQRGDLEQAWRAFLAAEELGADPGATATRLALLAHRRGDYETARAGFEDAGARVRTARGRAWLLVQLGATEAARGRFELALARYEAAEAEFPGWWLVTRQRVAALEALGRRDEAALLRVEAEGQSTDTPGFHQVRELEGAGR